MSVKYHASTQFVLDIISSHLLQMFSVRKGATC